MTNHEVDTAAPRQRRGRGCTVAPTRRGSGAAAAPAACGSSSRPRLIASRGGRGGGGGDGSSESPFSELVDADDDASAAGGGSPRRGRCPSRGCTTPDTSNASLQSAFAHTRSPPSLQVLHDVQSQAPSEEREEREETVSGDGADVEHVASENVRETRESVRLTRRVAPWYRRPTRENCSRQSAFSQRSEAAELSAPQWVQFHLPPAPLAVVHMPKAAPAATDGGVGSPRHKPRGLLRVAEIEIPVRPGLAGMLPPRVPSDYPGLPSDYPATRLPGGGLKPAASAASEEKSGFCGPND